MDEGSPSVDWWSLGVIMFECLTGVPPFNDETPLKVFQNILNRDIPWPESLPVSAKDIIDGLLSLHPEKRLGINGVSHVKSKAFFNEIQWEELRKSENIIVPSQLTAPKDLADTSMFHKRNSIYKSEEHDLSPTTSTQSPSGVVHGGGGSVGGMTEAIQIPTGKQSIELQTMEDREEIKNFSFKNLSSLRDMTQQMLRLMGEDASSTSPANNQK
jgi:serine/threonine-protein kinase RIM15